MCRDFEAAGGLGVKFDVKAHKKPTNAIDGCGGLGIGGGAPELVTGGQDGAVHVREAGGSHCWRDHTPCDCLLSTVGLP